MITLAEADRNPASRDSTLIWEWRNDPVTRGMSRTTDAIPWEHHQAWYAATDARIVMVSVDGNPAAMIRFDALECGAAEININLNPAARGKGLGVAILAAGCAYGFEELALERIRAEVKPENLPSITIFERVGFVFEGEKDGLRRYQLKRG